MCGLGVLGLTVYNNDKLISGLPKIDGINMMNSAEVAVIITSLSVSDKPSSHTQRTAGTRRTASYALSAVSAARIRISLCRMRRGRALLVVAAVEVEEGRCGWAGCRAADPAAALAADQLV